MKMSLRPADEGEKGKSVWITNEGNNQLNTDVDHDAANQQCLRDPHLNVESVHFFPKTGVLGRRGNISIPGYLTTTTTSSIDITSDDTYTIPNDIFTVKSLKKMSQSVKGIDEEDEHLRKKPKLSMYDKNELFIKNTCREDNVNVSKTPDSLPNVECNSQQIASMRTVDRYTSVASHKPIEYGVSPKMSPQSLLVSCLKCLKSQIDQDFEQNVLKNFRILKDCGMRQILDVSAIESFKTNIMEIFNSVESSQNMKLQIKEEIEYVGNPYVPKYKEMFYKLLKMIDFSKLTKEHSGIICDIYIHLISIAVLIGALVRAVDGESNVRTGCKSLYTINVKSLLKQINIVSQRILQIIKAILKCLVKDNSEFFDSDNFLTSMDLAVHPSRNELKDDSDCEIIEEFSTLPKPKNLEKQGHISNVATKYRTLQNSCKVVEGDMEPQPSSTGVHAIWINQEKMVKAVERQYSEDSSDTDYTVFSLWSQQLFTNPSSLFDIVPTFLSSKHDINATNMISSKDNEDKIHVSNGLMNVEDFYLDINGLVTFKDLFSYNFDAKAWDDRRDIIRNHNTFVVTDIDYSDPSLRNVRIKVENELNHLNFIDNSDLENSEFVIHGSKNGNYFPPCSNNCIPSLHRMCVNVLQNIFSKQEDTDWEYLSMCTSNSLQNVPNSNTSDQCSDDNIESAKAISISNAYEEPFCDNNTIKKIPPTLNILCLDVLKSLLSTNKNEKDLINGNRSIQRNSSHMSYKDLEIIFDPPTLLTLCTNILQEIFRKPDIIISQVNTECGNWDSNEVVPLSLKQLCFITIKKIFSGDSEQYKIRNESLSPLASSNICNKLKDQFSETKYPMTLAQQALITINKNMYCTEEELDHQLHGFDDDSNHSDLHLSDYGDFSSELFESAALDNNLPAVKEEPFSDDDLTAVKVKSEHNYFTEENFNRFEDEFMRNYFEETTGQLIIPTIVDTNVLSATDFNNLGSKDGDFQKKLLQIKKEIVEPESVEPQYLCRPIVVKKEGVKTEYEPDSDSDNDAESLLVEIPNKYRDDSELPFESKRKRGRPKKGQKKNPVQPVPTAANVSFQQAPAGKRFNTRSSKLLVENSLSEKTATAEANTATTTDAPATIDETVLSETVPANPVLREIEQVESFEPSTTIQESEKTDKVREESDLSTYEANNHHGRNCSNTDVNSGEETSRLLELGKSKKAKKIKTADESMLDEATAAQTTAAEVTAESVSESAESKLHKALVGELEPENRSLKTSKIFEDTDQIGKSNDNVDRSNIWRDDSDLSTHEADNDLGENLSSESSDMDSSEEISHLLDLGKTKRGKKRRKVDSTNEVAAEEKLSKTKNILAEVEMDIKSVVEEKREVISKEAQLTDIKLENENGAYVLKDGWKVYDIQDGDTKLFELCTVPLDKLPDAFAANYLMDFQHHHEEKEINSLIDFSNLTRRTKDSDSVGKEEEVKSRLKKTAVRKTDMVMNKNGKYEYHKVYSESESDAEACEAKKPKNLKDEEQQPKVSQENEAARNCLVNSSEDEDGSRIPKVEPETQSQEISSAQKLKAEKKEEKASPTFEASSTSSRTQRTSAKKSGITNGLLMEKLSGTDSEEEERRWQQKKKMLTVMQRKRLQKLQAKVPKSDEDDDGKKLSTEEYKIQRTRNKKRRREILMKMEKEFIYSGGLLISQGQKLRGRSTKSKPARGRKNIRQILDKDALAASTKQATREEEERRQRLNQKNAKLKEVFGIEGSVNVMKIDGQLCLDYDIEESKPLVSVHSRLTEPMKHHQCEGVKFMWDSCFESLARVKSGAPGGGCILAHCMGLGKTLQVIALVHTIMKIPEMRVKHVLVCCPLSTALNWVDEFHKWLGGWDQSIKVFEMSKLKKNYERCYQLEDWYKEGGVFVIGYEMFRMLTTLDPKEDDVKLSYWTKIKQTLLEPGPDVVVCDEGHLLKNDHSSLAAAMSCIATKRRITLTGTPMQNNLKEYYCMVNFVRPNLLGTYREFVNRFESPIMNGQHRDSSENDIKIMKWRSHILHNMLEGCLQRMEASVLDPYLPKKHEYVLLITLSTCQASMYKHFLDNFVSKCKEEKSARRCLLRDFYVLQKIWTHPRVLHLFEASFKNISRDSAIKTETDMAISAMEEEITGSMVPEATSYKAPADAQWWLQYLDGGALLDSIEVSHKFTIVFNILDECEKLGDKTLLFSTSLFTLDALEYFLQKVRGWHVGADYYRLDGSVPADIRQKWCRDFNTEGNKAKLFLMSTRVGSLGINMVGANRVIIFDTSWNPAHDIQSIFRVYRFGQQKECFIYRLVAMGTMEERIYERCVFKTAVSCRVVDEHQIDRHYNMADLSELYKFTDSSQLSEPEPFPTRVPPRDALVATLLLRCGRQLRRCHEHDSLLRNMCDEQLDEAERQQAWDQFNTEHLSKEREAEIQEESRKAAEQLRKQKSGEYPVGAAGVQGVRLGDPVPLHPALYDNPYFVTIVATALRTARPDMTDESALKTAKLNLNLLKKHHLPDVYSVIHSIAIRTLGEVTLKNLWATDNKTPQAQSSGSTYSLPQLAPAPSQSLPKTNQKPAEDMPSSSSTTPPPTKATTITRKKLSKSIVTKTSTEAVVPNISITERPVPVEGSLVAVSQPGPSIPTQLQYMYKIPVGMPSMCSNVSSPQTRLIAIEPGQMGIAVPAKLVKQKDGKTILIPNHDMNPVPNHLVQAQVARASESIVPDEMPTIASAPTPVGMIRNQHSFISMDVPDIEESILPDDMPRFQNASPPPLAPIDRFGSPEQGEEELAEDILLNYIRKQQQNQEATSKTDNKKPEAKSELKKPVAKSELKKPAAKLELKKPEPKSELKKPEVKTQSQKLQTRSQLKKQEVLQSQTAFTTEKKKKESDVIPYSNKKNSKVMNKTAVPTNDDDDVYIIPDDDDDDTSQEVTITSSTPSKSKISELESTNSVVHSSKSVPHSSSNQSLQITFSQTGKSTDKTELQPVTKPVIRSKLDKFTSSRVKLEMLLGNTKIIRKKVADTSSLSDRSDVQSENEGVAKNLGRENVGSSETGQVTITRLSDRKSMSANQIRKEVPAVTDTYSPLKTNAEVGVTIFKQSIPLSLQNNSSIDPLAMDDGADILTIKGSNQTKKQINLSKSQVTKNLPIRITKSTDANTEKETLPVTSDDDLIVLSPEESQDDSTSNQTSIRSTNGNTKKTETVKIVSRTSTPSKVAMVPSKTLPSVNIDDDIIDITPDDHTPSTSIISSYSRKSAKKIPAENLVFVKPRQKSLVRILPTVKNLMSTQKASTVVPKAAVSEGVTTAVKNVTAPEKKLTIIPKTNVPKSVIEAAKKSKIGSQVPLPTSGQNATNNEKVLSVTNTPANRNGESSALIQIALTTQKNSSSSEVIDLDSYVSNTTNKKQTLPPPSKAAIPAKNPGIAKKPSNTATKPPPQKGAMKRPGPLSKVVTLPTLPKRKCLEIIELD